jgi:hypothetical protein
MVIDRAPAVALRQRALGLTRQVERRWSSLSPTVRDQFPAGLANERQELSLERSQLEALDAAPLARHVERLELWLIEADDVALRLHLLGGPAEAPDLSQPEARERWLDKADLAREAAPKFAGVSVDEEINRAGLRAFFHRADALLKLEDVELRYLERFSRKRHWPQLSSLDHEHCVFAQLRHRGRSLGVLLSGDNQLGAERLAAELIGAPKRDRADHCTVVAHVSGLLATLSLRKQGYRHGLLRLFRAEDLELACPEFDRLFWIRSAHPEQGRRLLTPDAQRALIMLARSHVPSLTLEDGLLTLTWRWPVDVAHLALGLDIVARVAEQGKTIHHELARLDRDG